MRLTGKVSFLILVLGLIGGFAATFGAARAQQPEKRIALVVGNGAYAKSPLATAANDAGLIAQTLQAAGFDVVGARDLDGDTLRKSFRDFIQKAQTSGPGTVAMVYLAGYGIQLAGENYFVPVDSAISRDTDIPTEALRLSDYMRQLAALPLKANIVVLDAARQQPFIEGGQPIASGLALVEPEQNMLVAFNAAPGTVAPSEQGPYGVYAQSLAEMIRTGGLPLAEVFNRVRLRVNDASKGAQVPWNAEKIQAQFAFFERAPDAPPVQGTPDQVAAIQTKPLRDLGAQEAYTAALERDTLQAYEEFLAAYPDDPLARRVRAIVAARREAITWRRTYRADTPEAYWSYLRRYPRGPHAGDARRRLAILTAPPEPPPSFVMIDYDVPPPPPDEIVYVDRPVLYFGDPDFDFVPPPPAPVFYLPPPPPDFVVLPPPIAPIGLFILPQPIFVPIPVFVQPPVYVAPPPNNIIYNNIHNTTVINNVINQPAAAALAPTSPAPAVSGRATAAAPAVPPAVAQRAALIQQGKAPVPPSASINPTARVGTTTPAPTNVAPSATTPQGQQRLPAANTLPVPGVKGAPPPPPAAGPTPPGAATTRLAPSATAPSTTPPLPGRGPTAPGTAKLPPSGTTAPSTTTPLTTTAPAGTLPKTPGAQTLTTPNSVVTGPGKSGSMPPPPTPPTPGKPAVTSIKPTGSPPPPPSRLQTVKPPPPAVTRTPPPPPPVAARPVTPPPRISAPPPPPRISSPPPPPPRISAPPPPPPRISAPPPPPPRIAAPPPPPPRISAPPPQARIAAPPPPAPRIAAPPPPRPAPPPPPAAAAKKCPPNVPRC